MSNNKDQISGQENGQPCCDGGSCCSSGSDGSGKSWKMFVFILIVIAAGAVMARSLIRKSDPDGDQSQQVFASIQMDNGSETPTPAKAAEKPAKSEIEIENPPVAVETKKQDEPVKGVLSLWKADLDSLASLNKVAADADAVFVLLAANDQLNNQVIIKDIEAAARKIMANGTKVSAFRLKESAPDYAQLAKQVSVPSVLAMVKGRGMRAVSGEISETKLVQAFVAASRPSGCGPGAAGCGPTGCEPVPATPGPKK